MESPKLFWHVTRRMLTAGDRRFGTAYQVQNQGAVKDDNYMSIAPYSPTDEAIVRIDSEKCSEGKGKDKFLPSTVHEDPEGKQRYSYTLSLTSALDWVIGQRPGHFSPGKETRYPLHRRLGGPQDRSGRVRKISPPPGFDPRTLEP